MSIEKSRSLNREVQRLLGSDCTDLEVKIAIKILINRGLSSSDSRETLSKIWPENMLDLIINDPDYRDTLYDK